MDQFYIFNVFYQYSIWWLEIVHNDWRAKTSAPSTLVQAGELFAENFKRTVYGGTFMDIEFYNVTFKMW